MKSEELSMLLGGQGAHRVLALFMKSTEKERKYEEFSMSLGGLGAQRVLVLVMESIEKTKEI